VTGNTKYDQLPALPDERARDATRERLGLPADARLWTWGSLRPGEEPALAVAARALPEDGLVLVAAPRHPERAEPQKAALERLGVKVLPWTPGAPWPAPLAGPRVVWTPVLGVLRELYEASEVATVGGTFAPWGGHNAAEPAALGVPVVVGPHHGNARELVEALRARGGGEVATGGVAAAKAALRWTSDRETLAMARACARRAVEDLAGACARTIGFLEARGFWG
jgi:3-deoxy-D-manno-octulosonic-acid transferase